MMLTAGRDPSQPIKVDELRDLMAQQNRVGLARAMGSLGRPPGSDPGGPPDEAPSQFIESSIRNFDANGDGVITADEVARLDDGTRARYESMIRAAGRDPSQPIKVEEVRDLMVQQNRVGLAQAMFSLGRPPGGGPGSPTGKP
jgi:Ca2+-binding EF-hand superfamily protein